MKIVLRHKSSNKVFEHCAKDFRAIQVNWFSSKENENNCQKNLENSWETLKIAEHILKDTHNPKLNILECDKLLISFHRSQIKVF